MNAGDFALVDPDEKHPYRNKGDVPFRLLSAADCMLCIDKRNNWCGVPVVDENKILLGVVLRSDILEAETERLTQEHLETQGIVGGEELRSMPLFLRARRRLSWLSVNTLVADYLGGTIPP